MPKSHMNAAHCSNSPSLDEWIGRPQNRKTLQYQPEHVNQQHLQTNLASPLIIPEASHHPRQHPRGVPVPVEPDHMTSFLRQAASYGMALQRYDAERQRMEGDDHGAMMTRPTWDQLPQFPLFPVQKHNNSGGKR
ncbi:Hypothetical protein, putative [Bodo saltans]|uniref:Uncharacterized protein n=1 Tax=Bodo saltans TaxID=75058 RepID=A0A0S4JI11_BODSA|nr:Hypothetical protein, putative [Bodo saltans]|eukprot:CUG91149.1 Hypothetical protein, putative [Bodo saltans]